MTEKAGNHRMPTLAVETVRTDPVTFVEAIIESERPCTVRLETRVDGAVWPPRRNGTVLDRWDADGVTVEANTGTTAVGFATPVTTGERPIEIVRSEPREGNESVTDQWIERIERRTEAAEAVASVESVPEATDAMADVGGIADLERLAEEVARDRRLAAELSIVPEELSERLEAVEIPVESFVTLDGAAE